MKKIAVLTSGGDAPGMNACIRSVVRSAVYHKLEVMGIRHGFQGMINNDIIALHSSSVSNIIHLGGTFLKTARSNEFITSEGRKKAIKNLEQAGIEGVVLIGGDGSFRGGLALQEEGHIPVIGVPGTIDNDMFGTDFCIGYDTALNTVVQAVDKIRDTAGSHDRLFFVEVMGRDAGFLALRSGIGVGAEAILIPETETYVDELIHLLKTQWQRHKTSMIVMVAEGDNAGGAFAIAEQVKARFNHYETRVSVLGHQQRGGSPSAADRLLAARLGQAAVDALINGASGQMVGIVKGAVHPTPLSKAVKHHKRIDHSLLHLATVLSS